jgi:hypothetical protein
MTPQEERELRELRDAVNNTRVLLKSLQRMCRSAVKLAYDLEERLEQHDSRLHREAQEAQHAHEDRQEPALVRA